MYRHFLKNWKKWNNQSYKWIFRKRNSHDIKFWTFFASVVLLIGGLTIHYLIGLSIDQNVDFQNLKKNNWRLVKVSLFDYWWSLKLSSAGCIMLAKIHFKLQKLKVKIFFISTFRWVKYYVLKRLYAISTRKWHTFIHN